MVKYADTMESWEPLWVFARRKSATPLVWLSRRPELFFNVGIEFLHWGLAMATEISIARGIGKDNHNIVLLSRCGYHDKVHFKFSRAVYFY
jgi:hypothetical protein